MSTSSHAAAVDTISDAALDELHDFVDQNRVQPIGSVHFEQFEKALHERIVAVEREMVAEELERYDVDLPAALCTVDVDGRELDIDHPEYIEFTIGGFIPFGHDRESQGLDGSNYFWVEDDDTFKARFLIPPSLPVGVHDVTFQVEGIEGEGASSVSISEHILPLKRCDPDELHTIAILQAYDERKYRIHFDLDWRANRIDSFASPG